MSVLQEQKPAIAYRTMCYTSTASFSLVLISNFLKDVSTDSCPPETYLHPVGNTPPQLEQFCIVQCILHLC